MRHEDKSMTLADEIEEVAAGEPIIGIVVGANHHDFQYEESNDPRQPPYPLETWEEAFERLDYTYDSGYGGQNCHDLYAWTESKVIFIHEYDGSTAVHWVPRNPVVVVPQADGEYVEIAPWWQKKP